MIYNKFQTTTNTQEQEGQQPKIFSMQKNPVYSLVAKSSEFNPTQLAFCLLQTKLKAKRPKKQAVEGGLYKALHIWWYPWVVDFRPSLTAKDFHPNI